MAWHIDFLPDKRVILIKTTGDIPYDELKDQFQQVARLAHEKAVNRFLFDDTELNIHVSTVDIYEIPRLIVTSGFSRASRIAVVISPEEDRVEDYRFLETVSRNEGFNVRLFFSLEEGCEWLGQ